MNIKQITLEHKNPSLGPHETKTKITISVSKDNMEKVTAFIKKSTVNETVTLYEYIKAVRSKNSKILNDVLKNGPDAKLNKGETISNLSFYFDDDPPIKLDDVYRQYRLSYFNPEFTSYMLEKGNVTRHSPGSRPERENIKKREE